jgi:hypothetical protein
MRAARHAMAVRAMEKFQYFATPGGWAGKPAFGGRMGCRHQCQTRRPQTQLRP